MIFTALLFPMVVIAGLTSISPTREGSSGLKKRGGANVWPARSGSEEQESSGVAAKLPTSPQGHESVGAGMVFVKPQNPEVGWGKNVKLDPALTKLREAVVNELGHQKDSLRKVLEEIPELLRSHDEVEFLKTMKNVKPGDRSKADKILLRSGEFNALLELADSIAKLPSSLLDRVNFLIGDSLFDRFNLEKSSPGILQENLVEHIISSVSELGTDSLKEIKPLQDRQKLFDRIEEYKNIRALPPADPSPTGHHLENLYNVLQLLDRKYLNGIQGIFKHSTGLNALWLREDMPSKPVPNVKDIEDHISTLIEHMEEDRKQGELLAVDSNEAGS